MAIQSIDVGDMFLMDLTDPLDAPTDVQQQQQQQHHHHHQQQQQQPDLSLILRHNKIDGRKLHFHDTQFYDDFQPLSQINNHHHQEQNIILNQDELESPSDRAQNFGPAVRITNENQPLDHLYELDECDDVLEQNYNENHQNHYPDDESGDDSLSEDDYAAIRENPSKILKSIEALARSVHDDNEIFGSLPRRQFNTGELVRSLRLA